MDLVVKIGLSLALAFGIVWTLLPWAFGVKNYAKAHSKFLVLVARTSWLLLLVAHPVFIYLVWIEAVNYGSIFLCLFIAHVAFYKLFGRDVSTC